MNVSDIPVAELLPHAGNMVLLDNMLSVTENTAEAELTVKNDGLFHGAPDLPAWVGVELMAQVIAGWAGYTARRNNEPVKVGFLVGTRKYQSNVHSFTAGERLRIHIERAFQDANGMASFDCVIKDQSGSILVNANINVYQPDEQQFKQMMESST